MNALFAIVLAAASVTAPAPAPEAPPRWSLDASFGGSYVTDRSFDLVSNTDAMPSGELRLGFAPGWLNRHLELDLALGIDGISHPTFQTWDGHLVDRGLQVGLRYRQPLGRIVSVYGRVAGFVDLDTLRISADDGSLQLSQTVWSPGVQFGAGVELIAVRWTGGALGFSLEVGYALHPVAAHFDALTPDTPDSDTAPIAFAPIDAGSINLSGIRWRLGVGVHF